MVSRFNKHIVSCLPGDIGRFRGNFCRLASTGMVAAMLAWWQNLPSAEETQPTWLAVDTGELTLSVMRDEEIQAVYENIAIGSNGATWNKLRRDEKTPLGDFKINEIRPSDRFGQFISLDYPTLEHARRAYRNGTLGENDYRRIKRALAAGRAPPQDTSLGGHIGIHGIGNGNLEVHQHVNWTDGCIALTNEQLEALAEQVGTGTPVRVR